MPIIRTMRLVTANEIDLTLPNGEIPGGGSGMQAPTLDQGANKTISCTGKSLPRAIVCAALRLVTPYPLYLAGLMTLAAPLCGCTPLKEYVHNGFKVGPNYSPPPAPVAQNWIDSADPRVRNESDDLS